MKKTNLILATVLGSLMALPSATAEDFAYDSKSGAVIPLYIGQVLLLSGMAFKVSSDGEVPIDKGSKLQRGDRIKTSKDSMVKIQMADDTIMALGSNSELSFQQFDFKSKEERKSILEVISGKFRALFVHKSKEGDITLKTPTMALGIRGTEFLLNTLRLPSGEQVDQLAVVEGLVAAKNLKAQKDQLISAGSYWYGISDAQGQIQKEGKLELDNNKIKELNPQIDQEKQFAPFLDFVDSEKIKKGESSVPSIEVRPEGTQETAPPKKWRQSLKELNKALKENREKTP
jgi:hypothetical protein